MKRINNYFPENVTISGNAKIKVYNLSSPRTGDPVKNQFCISIPLANITRFQSYNTTCLVYDRDCRILTVYPEAFGYSVTTSKYSKVFLREELNLSEAHILEIVKMAKTRTSGETARCISVLNKEVYIMKFTTFIYYFGTVCFAAAITTLLFVVIDVIERKH